MIPLAKGDKTAARTADGYINTLGSLIRKGNKKPQIFSASFPKAVDFYVKITYNNIASTEKNVVSLIDVLKYVSLLFLKKPSLDSFLFFIFFEICTKYL